MRATGPAASKSRFVLRSKQLLRKMFPMLRRSQPRLTIQERGHAGAPLRDQRVGRSALGWELRDSVMLAAIRRSGLSSVGALQSLEERRERALHAVGRGAARDDELDREARVGCGRGQRRGDGERDARGRIGGMLDACHYHVQEVEVGSSARRPVAFLLGGRQRVGYVASDIRGVICGGSSSVEALGGGWRRRCGLVGLHGARSCLLAVESDLFGDIPSDSVRESVMERWVQ